MFGCLSRCVSPVIDWQPVQGTPHFALCQLRKVKDPTEQDDNEKKWMDDKFLNLKMTINLKRSTTHIYVHL